MGPAPLEGVAVSRFVLLWTLLVPCGAARAEPARPAVIVAVGAAGTPEFGAQFRAWSSHWEAAAQTAQADFTAIGLEPASETSDRDQLRERLAALAAGESQEPVWLVLIGHGTYDGKAAKYNLRGEDIAPAELAAWLQPIQRPVAVINCTSASGPFLNGLSGPNRVVVTATRAGSEYNFARFGEYISSALTDLTADLDKDDQVSLLEAFLFASAGVREFYAGEGRLATEHALLDDNGDGLGTPAEWFSGLRATKRAKDGAELDGLSASQLVLVRSPREEQLSPETRARRDDLERQLAALRQAKANLSEDEYLGKIEPILIELGRLYEQADKAEASR